MPPKSKASPKPVTFKSPDGREFASKSEYRDHMMATYYSFKNKSDEKSPLIKAPGDVDGQPFDISQCAGTTMVIMDMTEAIQIDNLTNCRVFIGCCVSSIFIRNCNNCIFYTCCRQLRLREVTQSTLYVYSQAEVHIEQSTGLSFAPFNGGYAEQTSHFKTAGLDPSKNLWYDIFDHNDPAKTRRNWSLLDPSVYEPSWYPQGVACTPCVPITTPGSSQALDAGKDSNQVGQAFGMEQMMADAKRMEEELAASAATRLNMETALLIASAMGKGINVSIWLTEGGGVDGRVPQEDFNAKLISMGLVVGVEEDWETKKELEIATSKTSLKNIAEVCGKGRDQRGALIDVVFFIAAAQKKVADYLSQAEGDAEEAEAEAFPAKSQAFPPAPPSINNTPKTSIASVSPASSSPSARYLQEREVLDTIVVPSPERPTERPSTSGTYASRIDHSFGATLSENARSAPSSPMITVPSEAMQNLIPDSPYDEEVAFNLEEDEEVDTVLPYGSHRSSPAAKSRSSPAGKGAKLSERPRSATKKESPAVSLTKLQPPRPSTAGPSRSPAKQSRTPRTGAASSSAVRSASAGALSRGTRAAPTSAASVQSSVLRSSLSATNTKPINIMEEVKLRTSYAIRHTDLYHLVQVHLGFIDSYRIVPARGPIVTAKPRPWLTIRDLKDAFAAARENFSDAHVMAVMKNVLAFALEHGAAGTSLTYLDPSDVFLEDSHGPVVSAAWMKKYLVHLRLGRRNSLADSEGAGAKVVSPDLLAPCTVASRDGPIEWKQWLGKKMEKDDAAKSAKPNDFRRALGGRPHSLSREELDKMLLSLEIIPAESIKVEVSQRVRAWAMDMDGRMDFAHSLHVLKRKYLRENALSSWRQLSAVQQKEVDSALRKKLIASKSEELFASERAQGSLTKALFKKFEAFNRSHGYESLQCLAWGTWLGKHHAKTEENISKFRQQSADRKAAMAIKKSRGRAMAPLAEVQSTLLKAAGQLRPAAAIELTKSLQQLRRTVMVGKSGNALVSKQTFEKHLDSVLAPRLLELPIELRSLANEARHSHEGLPLPRAAGDEQVEDFVDTLFKQDQVSAEEKAAAIEAEKLSKKTADFEEWRAKKEKLQADAVEKKNQLRESQKAAKEKKAKLAQKAFKTWVKLRKDNKYATKVATDGQHVKKIVRSVPDLRRVSHDVRWNKDAELPGYTY